MSIVKKYLLFVVLCAITLTARGQAARSPFSTFGIGESYGNALAHNQGMAGVGVSAPQFWNLNNQNPALLVYNSFTVFGAGVIAERRTISADTISEKITGGNMNYLVTAFPILPARYAGEPTRWTTSLGLMPFSTVKYKIQYVDDIAGSTEQVDVTEEGTGGITQLYWSNGVKITNDLAVGLKTAYLFSSIVTTYKNKLINSTQPANYYAGLEEKSYVKDLALSAGISYSKDSLFNRKLYRLSVGMVYNFAADLNTTKSDKLYRSTTAGDTIESTTLNSRKGSIYLPSSLTLGVALSRGSRWTVATDFSYQDWASFKSINEDDGGLGKAWRIALGGEITPDAFAVENFLKRMTYRVGLSMEQYPFLANNQSVKDLGINFGLSVPTGRSSLDLGFKLGQRGNKKENILQESYFKIYFGITFNDQWFIKRRFD
jgi:long-subunit fatty acid transport protein